MPQVKTRAKPKRKALTAESDGATGGYKVRTWQMGDDLSSSMGAAEYTRTVLDDTVPSKLISGKPRVKYRTHIVLEDIV